MAFVMATKVTRCGVGDNLMSYLPARYPTPTIIHRCSRHRFTPSLRTMRTGYQNTLHHEEKCFKTTMSPQVSRNIATYSCQLERTKPLWNNSTQTSTSLVFYNERLSGGRQGPCCKSDRKSHTNCCIKIPMLKKYPGSKSLLPATTSNVVDEVSIHNQSDGVKPTERYFILSPKGLVQASPAFLKPYLQLMRFDRPIGTWLLFLPCAFSISMAAPAGQLPDPVMLTLFGLGSFFMRGAGCTINDMWDKDFDAQVARTMDRPLACGQVSYLQALTFLGVQLSVSLAILLTFNWNTIALGVASLIPCITYPLMKRITYWPQAFLGLTFNYGVLMGWCAATGGLDLGTVVPLYAAGIAWTLVYDTIYGHQDKEDDVLVGVKSTALKFGENTKPWLVGFSAVTVAGLAGSGWMCEQTWPFYLGVGVTGAHLLYQTWSVNLDNPDDCGRKFRSNRNLGIVLWIAIMTGTLLKEEKEKTKMNAGAT